MAKKIKTYFFFKKNQLKVATKRKVESKGDNFFS